MRFLLEIPSLRRIVDEIRRSNRTFVNILDKIVEHWFLVGFSKEIVRLFCFECILFN